MDNAKDNKIQDIPKLKTGESLVILQRSSLVIKDISIIQIMLSALLEGSKKLDILVLANDPTIGNNAERNTVALDELATARKVLDAAKEMRLNMPKGRLTIINDTAEPDSDVVQISEIFSGKPVSKKILFGEFYKSHCSPAEIDESFRSDLLSLEREKQQVESGHELADRLEQFLSFTRTAPNYHAHHYGRKLVFWAINRFDTPSSYFSRIAAHPAELHTFRYLAEFDFCLLHIDENGTVSIIDGGRKYATKLRHSYVRG